jgi:hypothetical protein
VVSANDFTVPTFHVGCTAAVPAPGTVSTVPMPVVQSGPVTYEYVPVCIGGQGPFPFILDTGASGSVVDTTLAEQLGLAAGGSIVGQGVSCSVTGQTVSLADWSLGSVSLDPQSAIRIAIPGFGASDAPAGLLGSDVLSRFGAARLDFASHSLQVEGPEGSNLGSGIRTGGPTTPPPPAALTQGRPATSVPMEVLTFGYDVQAQVRVTIGGHLDDFVLDTGAGQSTVSAAVATVAHLDPTGGRIRLVAAGCTFVASQVASGPWQVGTVPLTEGPMVKVPTAGLPAAGLLGSDRLRAFGWIVVDYAGAHLVLGQDS